MGRGGNKKIKIIQNKLVHRTNMFSPKHLCSPIKCRLSFTPNFTKLNYICFMLFSLDILYSIIFFSLIPCYLTFWPLGSSRRLNHRVSILHIWKASKFFRSSCSILAQTNDIYWVTHSSVENLITLKKQNTILCTYDSHCFK